MSPSVAGSDVRHSSHICLPFETDDENHEATVTFIHEGLSRGARCVFTGSKEDFDAIGRGLEQRGICSRRAAARGALQLRPVEEIYFPDGFFDPPRTLAYTWGDAIRREFERVLGEGVTVTLPVNVSVEWLPFH